MEIKNIKQLEEGMVIKYNRRIANGMPFEGGDKSPNQKKFKEEELMVIKVYKYFVMFRQLEPPYLTINLTNNELYQMGIYKEQDFVREFTR